jgi:hypothetical protein
MAVNHIDCFTTANVPNYHLKHYTESMPSRSVILSLLHLVPSPAILLRSHSYATVKTEFLFKSSICQDIMSCQPTLKIHLQGQKITLCWFLAWLIPRIHDIISKKTELTITTVVRTFNNTKLLFSLEVHFYNCVHFSIMSIINESS